MEFRVSIDDRAVVFILVGVALFSALGIVFAAPPNPGHSWDEIEFNGSAMFDWGSLCREIEFSSSGTQCCNPDEYLVDIWVSDDDSNPDAVAGSTQHGWGGCLRSNDYGGNYGMLCCKNP
jgi:hypothetical protein